MIQEKDENPYGIDNSKENVLLYCFYHEYVRMEDLVVFILFSDWCVISLNLCCIFFFFTTEKRFFLIFIVDKPIFDVIVWCYYLQKNFERMKILVTKLQQTVETIQQGEREAILSEDHSVICKLQLIYCDLYIYLNCLRVTAYV